MKRHGWFIFLGLVIGLAGGMVFWFLTPPAPVFLPADGLPVGGGGPVGLRFARPMQAETVASRMFIDGSAPAWLVWENERTLWVTPDGGLAAGGQHILALSAGALSLAGWAEPAREWSFAVRPAWIIFQSPSGAAGDLWRVDPAGELAVQITNTDGRVVDFHVSPDGQQIVYTVGNELAGSDIWVARRDGAAPRLLVRCLSDRCSAPAWSTDGKQIAYALVRARPLPGETRGSPRPMLADASSGETEALSNDPLVAGNQFSWSADGARLAFYDPSAALIRVRELDSGVEIALSSTTGQFEWSPDGQRLLFSHEDLSGGFAAMRIYMVDLATGATSILTLDGGGINVDISLPRWSPDGEWLAYGRTTGARNPAKQIWLARADGSQAQAITNDPSQTHTAYQWSPQGSRLMYQQYAFGSSDNLPQVVVWDRSSEIARVIAEDAIAPQWLP